MKKLSPLLIFLFLSLPLFATALASGDLDDFVGNLNVQAGASLGTFKLRLSAQFGVPVPRIDDLMVRVAVPGDLYMCLRIGQVASLPIDAVLREYQASRGKGWGTIAKNLGIKPGSREFHALKAGGLGGGDDSGPSRGKGKGRGRGR